MGYAGKRAFDSSTKDDFISRLLYVDACVTTLGGVALYVAPDKIADYAFSRPTDGVHWHLVRCIGGHLLATAFACCALRRNPLARTIITLMRLITSVIVLMLLYHIQSQTPKLMRPEALEGLRYLSAGVFIVYLALWILNGWPVELLEGNELLVRNRLGNLLYQLDCLASILIGLAWLTFPSWLLHRQVLVPLDASHDLCGRIMGAFFVASHVIAQHALHWPDGSERRVVVDSRVVCCTAILGAQVWSQIAYERDWSGGHWVGISLFSTWTIIAMLYRIAILFSKSGEVLRTKEN